MAGQDAYLLGDDDGESQRLAAQHRIWAEVSHAAWRRAGFGHGDTLLDLGCGPGLCSVDLAQWVGPEGRVIAVDQSGTFLERVERRAAVAGLANVETLKCRVEALDLEPASLDGAWLRWLLCFLPDPGVVLDRVAAALKPGRPVVVLDYFNYRAFTLAPRSAAMDRLVAAIQASWQAAGGSLDVQGRVPGLMARAGLEVVEARQVSGLARPGSAHWHWPQSFLEGYVPRLVEQGLVDADTATEFWRDWHAAAARPESFLVLPPLFEIRAVRRA